MILAIILSAILIVIIGIVIICRHIGHCMVHIQSEPITELPSDYNLIYQDIHFYGEKDPIYLSGWWIPAQRERRTIASEYTVILSHGYHNSRTLEGIGLLNFAYFLTQHHYNVLMYDFRNCGYSQGKETTAGYLERYDLVAAIHYVKRTHKSPHIALIGWSMGAAVSLFAASLTEGIEAVIADSTFCDLKEYLMSTMKKYTRLPTFPFTWVTLCLVRRQLRINTQELRPIQTVKSLKEIPILFIHAKEDEVIPSKESQMIYDSIDDKSHVQLWIPDVKGHILSYKMKKEEYEQRVLDFFRKYFNSEE